MSDDQGPENSGDLIDIALQRIENILNGREPNASSTSISTSESNFNASISHDMVSTPKCSNGMSILMMNNEQPFGGSLFLVYKSRALLILIIFSSQTHPITTLHYQKSVPAKRSKAVASITSRSNVNFVGSSWAASTGHQTASSSGHFRISNQIGRAHV